ncbi:CotD family spore coat protein [Virgibacillus soli]|uniref:CotD family spore coat protein n=1 Tax=Paracerasibacillus soli TaxID=480284 RepID=A0ABU5CMJ6_9BACI|nr:CotD family spore coat protein [Virgibacillus soli]MDY0407593.1 CotD family spore coat protein [Virgibacillus soli]
MRCCRRHPQCGCRKRIVYPTKFNCVDVCTESEVEHVHPSHTTVMKHHLVKNTHVFPHSTSVVNTTNSVNLYGGSPQVPRPPRPNVPGPSPFVGGAMMPPMGSGMGSAPGQVAGTMSPGMNQGMGMGMNPGQVAGVTSPNMGTGMQNWNQGGKWC